MTAMVETTANFHAWLAVADPGEYFIYASGICSIARPGLNLIEQANKIRRAVSDAYETGMVTLAQRQRALFDYEYRVIRISPQAYDFIDWMRSKAPDPLPVDHRKERALERTIPKRRVA